MANMDGRMPGRGRRTDGVAGPGRDGAACRAVMQGRKGGGAERPQSERLRLLTFLTSAGCPGERLLQPVIAPEQLAIRGHESRSAEDAKLLRSLGLIPQPSLDRLGLCFRQHVIGSRTERPEQPRNGGDIV